MHIWGLCSCFNCFYFFRKICSREQNPPWGKKTSWPSVKGDISFICRFLRLFSLRAVLITFTLQRKCNREGEPGKLLVTGSSQISIRLSKSLRGELAIAEKLGQFKQIKSGSYSVVTQSFHSPICTVILHYPLIVTYTFHSPNMEDKYWIRLKLHRFPGCPAGPGKPFLRVLAAIYWSHGSEPALHLWNFPLFSQPGRKRSTANSGKCT